MKKSCLLILLAIVLSLSGCLAYNNDQALNNNGSVPGLKEDEQVKQQETDLPKGTRTPDPAKNEFESQHKTNETFKLTDKGKLFLTHMCVQLSDFDSQSTMDEQFWRDFIFYSYTSSSPEDEQMQLIYREDLGYDETVFKVPLQKVKSYAELVFGIEMPDIRPSFEDMEEGQTSCYFKDGYYYIGVSDFPDCQYTFAGCETFDTYAVVKYDIIFEGEKNEGTVSFTIVPQDNENGFIIRSKTTIFFD